jgi:hypothetical protein
MTKMVFCSQRGLQVGHFGSWEDEGPAALTHHGSTARVETCRAKWSPALFRFQLLLA